MSGLTGNEPTYAERVAAANEALDTTSHEALKAQTTRLFPKRDNIGMLPVWLNPMTDKWHFLGPDDKSRHGKYAITQVSDLLGELLIAKRNAS